MMKRVLFLFLISLSSYAQDKIEGIGRFRIGRSTIGLIDSLVSESGEQLSVVDNYMFDQENTSIGELVINRQNPHESPIGSSFCPDVRVFYMNQYEVSGIALTKIYLIFKNERLISLKSSNSMELEEALALKYGEKEPTVRTKPVSCGNETILSRRWVNNTLIATTYSRIYYNTSCKKQLVEYFWIRDTDKYDEGESCSEKAKSLLVSKQQQIKRDKLKDF
ncbi:hypothetical protein M0L20_01135 [Spirosoma sp. RP8]|uniref:Uncharacterized protein n=1 Tax=Spirosoma liriopis TaxID=2937440 RepID=A0ABT0HEZ4_9BACT|nr:hypothetical protein [Spirosoma liriopis]MCK8490432.1 hypothetical protein [Spirosoma liriopis]